jgi:hypothetical protein
MKIKEKISMLLRPLLLAMILISLEALMLFSCQKDECVNTDDIEETSGTPDERNDLAAFLDPLAGRMTNAIFAGCKYNSPAPTPIS